MIFQKFANDFGLNSLILILLHFFMCFANSHFFPWLWYKIFIRFWGIIYYMFVSGYKPEQRKGGFRNLFLDSQDYAFYTFIHESMYIIFRIYRRLQFFRKISLFETRKGDCFKISMISTNLELSTSNAFRLTGWRPMLFILWPASATEHFIRVLQVIWKNVFINTKTELMMVLHGSIMCICLFGMKLRIPLKLPLEGRNK